MEPQHLRTRRVTQRDRSARTEIPNRSGFSEFLVSFGAFFCSVYHRPFQRRWSALQALYLPVQNKERMQTKKKGNLQSRSFLLENKDGPLCWKSSNESREEKHLEGGKLRKKWKRHEWYKRGTSGTIKHEKAKKLFSSLLESTNVAVPLALPARNGWIGRISSIAKTP